MAIKKIPFENHDEWLAIRHKYLGGSDAGTVAGLNSYKSPYSLWAEKTDRIPPFEGNTITDVGSFLEEFVAQQFTKITGKQVRKSNFTYVNDKYPWACANVDRLVVGEDAILEIKTTGNRKYIEYINNGDPVPAWWAQMIHYGTVLEKKKLYLAVLMDCREVKVLEFDFNPAESEALMGAEKSFWDLVVSDTPPAVDGSQSTTEALTRVFPESDGTEIDLTYIEPHILQYKAFDDQIKALKSLQDAEKAAIEQYMGTAEKGRCGEYSISWKSSERSTFDRKAYEQNYGALPAGCMKTSTVRTFRFTENKK